MSAAKAPLVGSGYSVTAPSVVMRPIASPRPSVNHRAPSEPLTMSIGNSATRAIVRERGEEDMASEVAGATSPPHRGFPWLARAGPGHPAERDAGGGPLRRAGQREDDALPRPVPGHARAREP